MSETILLTGAAGGIGTAMTIAFLGAGHIVLALDLNPDALDRLAKATEGVGGKLHLFPCDITDPEAVLVLRERLRASALAPTALVNNAGIERRAETGRPDFLEVWQRVLDVNLTAAAFLSQAFADDLAKARGSIVNIASIQSFAVLHTANTAYAVSKAAIAQLTRAMAVEYAPRGIRVNAVAPGVVETPMIRQAGMDPARFSRFLDRIPMARFARPEEIAAPVVFLISKDASYITGAVLPVDGGFLAM